ncbi:MAG: 23S rRNA (uracil(1939)-C(5))-methyltransferase RlmD [Bacteroidota bacterium]
MGKRKSKIGKLIENLEVTDAASDGKAVAKKDGLVYFVNGGVPGDVIDAEISMDKRRFVEVLPVKFHQKSPYRNEPFCKHFGICGGCKWQNMHYERQLFFKQKQVKDSFERIGKLDFPEILPIIGSSKTKFYRNKLEFTFSEKEWMTKETLNDKNYIAQPALGFHIPGKFDKVLQIDECFLMDEWCNSIRNSIYSFAIRENIPFYHLKTHEGFLRTLMLRTSSAGETMVVMVFSNENESLIKKVMEFISSSFPGITSLQYIINKKLNDTIHDQEVILFKGKPFITENMEGLKFRISPKSFYQTNSQQAYELYKTARDFAGLTGSELVYDLYTGTGTIANFVARQCKKVIGIEYVEDAIADAKINSVENNIHNTSFFAGDMKDVLNDEFIRSNGKPDVIITDPPRAGMHEDVVNAILKIAPEKVVYVSCNPATQARDLALMKEQYAVAKVQPVDMFPQTHHVENVVLLMKK